MTRKADRSRQDHVNATKGEWRCLPAYPCGRLWMKAAYRGMNTKRWISWFALAALLIGNVSSVFAGAMLCGMKEPARVERCDHCDSFAQTHKTDSIGTGGCCRMGRAEPTEATPVTLVNSRPLETPGASSASFTFPVIANKNGFAELTSVSHLRAPLSLPPFPEPSIRTTILRN